MEWKLKGTLVTQKELKSAGFDFNDYDYKADLVVKNNVYRDALIINGYALMFDKTKSNVFVARLSDNPNVVVTIKEKNNK